MIIAGVILIIIAFILGFILTNGYERKVETYESKMMKWNEQNKMKK